LFCIILKADIDKLKERLSTMNDHLLISKLCVPQQFNTADYHLNITYYNLSDKMKSMLVDLNEWKKSNVFKSYWDEAAQQTVTRDILAHFSLEQIHSSVYLPASTQWKKDCKLLKSGEVLLRDLDTLTKTFQSNYEHIMVEFEVMCGKQLASERIDQFKNYQLLDRYWKGAELMFEVKNRFKLTGDFEVLTEIMTMVRDKNAQLRFVTRELVNSARQLQDITDKKLECLRTFLDHKSFSDWLRHSLSGPREIKVLVDLAMISAAGQGDLEVQKVSCLHAAVTGYAPLIYDLKISAGFKEFLPLCHLVWHQLEIDPELPTKFKDTARQLQWLERVKNSHGSVERNALASATAINTSGIYTVGNIKTSCGKRSIEDIIQLKLRLENDEPTLEGQVEHCNNFQSWSLQMLHDLQSKLMLVAGKAQEGQKDVDRFVEILDAVTRLGKLYAEICNAGCTLFHGWKAQFFCSPKRHMYARVEFGTDGKQVIYGKCTDMKDGVLDHILGLCNYFDECLSEWLSHIERHRSEFYYLNHYTMAQLVILQKELAKINTEEYLDISSKVYPLLTCVKENCILTDLQMAMRKTFRQLSEKNELLTQELPEKKKSLEKDLTVARQMEIENEAYQKKQKDQEIAAAEFVRDIIESGFSKPLAVRALATVGADITECMMWCMEHQDEEKNEDLDDGSAVDGPEGRLEQNNTVYYKGLLLNSSKDTIMAEFFRQNENDQDSMFSQLTKLWKEFQSGMDISVSDCLSISHVGVFLEILANLENVYLNRPIPNYLKKGRPNMIICRQSEVLLTVLSVYMNGAGAELALPGSDEVLLCSDDTTVEDIKLLFNRVRGDAKSVHRGKVYALVHAELLEYDVACHIEQNIHNHSQSAEDICLVIVCGEGERSNHSHVINALERYRVRLPYIDIPDVTMYLERHLKVKVGSGQKTVCPASLLDPDGFSVRVIKSHRAGVGKSLKVKRIQEELQNLKISPANDDQCICIRLHAKTICQSTVLKTFLKYTLSPQQAVPRIFHIDIAHEVQYGVDYLLFNLLVLGSITDRDGFVWCRSPLDLYLIETLPLMQIETKVQMNTKHKKWQCVHHIFKLLPTITCWSPQDCLSLLTNQKYDVLAKHSHSIFSPLDQKMDDQLFCNVEYQRIFQYLKQFDNDLEISKIDSIRIQGNHQEWLETILVHCGLQDPSWSELCHFVKFLGFQLCASESSVFCTDVSTSVLPGFFKFVVKFMIQMSKDFATRSLTISEASPDYAQHILSVNEDNNVADDDVGLALYGLKRRWETR